MIRGSLCRATGTPDRRSTSGDGNECSENLRWVIALLGLVRYKESNEATIKYGGLVLPLSCVS